MSVATSDHTLSIWAIRELIEQSSSHRAILGWSPSEAGPIPLPEQAEADAHPCRGQGIRDEGIANVPSPLPGRRSYSLQHTSGS